MSDEDGEGFVWTFFSPFCVWSAEDAVFVEDTIRCALNNRSGQMDAIARIQDDDAMGGPPKGILGALSIRFLTDRGMVMAVIVRPSGRVDWGERSIGPGELAAIDRILAAQKDGDDYVAPRHWGPGGEGGPSDLDYSSYFARQVDDDSD